MKKTEATNTSNAIDTNRIVHVDLGKLSTGLALTFKGVTAVFESLGADTVPGFGTVSTVDGEEVEESALEPAEDKTAKKSAKKDAKATEDTEAAAEAAGDNDSDTTEDTAEAPQTASEGVETTGADNTEAKPETSSEEPEKANKDNKAVEANKNEDTKAAGGSAFTLNDIMKIAAQKMAKDASVTEKIGALVKTYGVSTLKELPEEKFEAFMTDLTQI